MTKDNPKDDQKIWPDTFNEDELGTVPTVMLGGPLDGSRYKMPIFPDGSIPGGTACPLEQPHQLSPYAHYERAGDEMIGGYYVFFYTETRDSDGRVVLAENSDAVSPASETCEGFLENPLATDDVAQPEAENS